MMSSPSSATSLSALAEQAERHAQAGQHAAAARAYEQVLALAPEHPRALNYFAMQAFAQGRLQTAREMLDRAAASEPPLAIVEANRGRVLREAGDLEAALLALKRALKLDPGFVPARLETGDILVQLGRRREASLYYRAAVQQLPPPAQLPPPVAARVERAIELLQALNVELADHVDADIAAARRGLDREATARFDECIDILLGRRRVQLPKPSFLHFPKLPPLTFYPRALFDWAPRAEAAFADVRAEVQALLGAEQDAFRPYVQLASYEAASIWAPLNRSLDWGAYFLFDQGRRIEAHCDACPLTTAMLDALPQVRIPQRAPTAFFSRLRAGTHIPPHHGATNTRLTVHLPLIVPDGCSIRVGNDVSGWTPGELLIFDDTVEHEAWNRGAETRTVLIFDVWNPYLSETERALLTAATTSLAAFYGDAAAADAEL